MIRAGGVHPIDMCPYCGHHALDDHDSRAMDGRCDICGTVCRAPVPGDPIVREGAPLDFVATLEGFVRPFTVAIAEWLVTTQSGQRVYVLRAFDQDRVVALPGRLAWRIDRRSNGERS